MEYIRCEMCKKIINLSNREQECPFCGNDLAGSDKTSERVYREFWKDSVGQPFKYNNLKVSTQLTFIEVDEIIRNETPEELGKAIYRLLCEKSYMFLW